MQEEKTIRKAFSFHMFLHVILEAALFYDPIYPVVYSSFNTMKLQTKVMINNAVKCMK